MILLVGDDLNPNSNTIIPFKDTASGTRLAEWIKVLGYKREDVRIVNRTSGYFETAMMLAAHANIPIIALGNNASKALKDVPHFKLPHPSGRNRMNNDNKLISDKLKRCKEWLGK